MENGKLTNNQAKGLFILLVGLSLVIPLVIASKYNGEFSFGYPVGEEYVLAKTITAIIGALLMFNFLKYLHLKKDIKLILAFVSLVPIIRLITAVGMFYLWGKNPVDSKENITMSKRLKDVALLSVGFLFLYNFIFSVVGLILQTEPNQNVINILRIVVSSLFLYFIYKKNIHLKQEDFLFYVVLTFLTNLYLTT